MGKKQKEPVKTCADCIHESACRMWIDGRPISDDSASRCPNHETVKGSGAYLCGVLDERKRKQTNADRIRSMSDEELSVFLCDHGGCSIRTCPGSEMCNGHEGKANGLLKWLRQPAERTPIHGGFEDKTESGLLEEG